MAGVGERKSNDFYAVLGLEKECTPSELKNAYKKLAMRWHPDRCSASGNSKFVEEAKKKFQAIQEAYSVLSDETNRLLYDVGIYDNDDDENNDGMGEFLNEMVAMMSETKPSENGEESFEQLQELFEEMFQTDAFPLPLNGSIPSCSPYSGSMKSSFTSNNYKRSSSETNNGEGSSSFNAHFQNFCVGTGRAAQGRTEKGKGRHARRSK